MVQSVSGRKRGVQVKLRSVENAMMTYPSAHDKGLYKSTFTYVHLLRCRCLKHVSIPFTSVGIMHIYRFIVFVTPLCLCLVENSMAAKLDVEDRNSKKCWVATGFYVPLNT